MEGARHDQMRARERYLRAHVNRPRSREDSEPARQADLLGYWLLKCRFISCVAWVRFRHHLQKSFLTSHNHIARCLEANNVDILESCLAQQ
jgi:hypothetical protein